MNRLKIYADDVVNLIEAMKHMEDDEDQVKVSLSFNFDTGILVNKGIKELAEAVGEGLFFENVDDDMGVFHYRAYFDYRGYRFVQYCREGDMEAEV